MNDRAIFEAAERFQNGADALSNIVRAVLPQIEDALRGTDEHPGGAPSRHEFALACLDRVEKPIGQVLHGLDDLLRALGGWPLFVPPAAETSAKTSNDSQAPAPDQAPRAKVDWAIAFEHFRKLKEFMFVEKTMEVVATMRFVRRNAKIPACLGPHHLVI